MNNRRLLMISTDRQVFDKKSNVAMRQIQFAKDWDAIYILVFAQKGMYPKSVDLSENCHVYSTESASKFLYPFDAIALGKKIIAQNNVTEITCQDSSLTAMAGVALKRKFDIPLEIQIHTDIGSPYFAKSLTNKIRLHMAKKYLLKANKIRVVSGRIKDYVQSLLDRVGIKIPIEIRPIAVNENEIKNTPIIEGGDLHQKYQKFDQIVLMASRLEKEKNIELAINSWASVTKDFPRAGLVIVGSGSQLSDLRALVALKKLDNSVIFENWLDKEILYSYYKTADIFLNTSLFEGYGMTLKEASAVGAVIVSTDVGIAQEVGAVIVENEPADLAQKLKSILSQIVTKK